MERGLTVYGHMHMQQTLVFTPHHPFSFCLFYTVSDKNCTMHALYSFYHLQYKIAGPGNKAIATSLHLAKIMHCTVFITYIVQFLSLTV